MARKSCKVVAVQPRITLGTCRTSSHTAVVASPRGRALLWKPKIRGKARTFGAGERTRTVDPLITNTLCGCSHLAENPSKGTYSLMDCAMGIGRGMTPRYAATRGKGYSRVTVVTLGHADLKRTGWDSFRSLPGFYSRKASRSPLSCSEDHGAEHQGGDDEDDEHFPNHGLRHRHEARELPEQPVKDDDSLRGGRAVRAMHP